MAVKILHINIRSSYDGALVYSLRLCKNLHEFNHEIVCCFKGKAFEEILKLGIKCCNLINSSDTRKKFLLLKYIRFIKYIRRNHFDLIHYHQGGIGILLFAYWFRKHAKVIHHLHSGNLIGDNKKQNIPFIHFLLLKYLASKTYQIAVAEHVHNGYLRSIGLSKNLILIRNTVPYLFCKKKEMRNGIGFIGRFTNEKGFPLFKIIAGKMKNLKPSLKLYLMGEDSNQILNEYGKVGSNVEIILPSFDVTQFYDNIDLLIFLSIAPEGMPLTVLEALSFDVGVIAYPIPGVKEIVGNDYPLLVDEPEEIIMKIDDYYSNKISIKDLSLKHKNILETHNEAEMLNSIRNVYK